MLEHSLAHGPQAWLNGEPAGVKGICGIFAERSKRLLRPLFALQPLVVLALEEGKDPDFLLKLLNCVAIPAADQVRHNAPFLEEGLLLAVMRAAAQKGHVELAFRAWDYMEYCLLPMQLTPQEAASAAPPWPHASLLAGADVNRLPVSVLVDCEGRWPGAATKQALSQQPEQDAIDGKETERRGTGEANGFEEEEDENEGWLDPSALLPCHVPSISAFQTLIDTFVRAGDLRFV
jgi:hypothetical protein